MQHSSRTTIPVGGPAPTGSLIVDQSTVMTLEQQYHWFARQMGLPTATAESKSACRRARISLGLGMLHGKLPENEFEPLRAKSDACHVGPVTCKLVQTVDMGRIYVLSIGNDSKHTFECTAETLPIGAEIVKNSAQRDCEWMLSKVDSEIEGLLLLKVILKLEFGSTDPERQRALDRAGHSMRGGGSG